MSRAAYHAQIAAARDHGLRLTAEQLRQLQRLLEQHADELAARVAAGLARRGEQYAAAVAREIIRQFTLDLARLVRDGVTITARQVAEIHARATLALIESAGVTGLSTFSPAAGLGAAQAVLSRPELARAFRSIRRDSIATVDGILRRAMVRRPSTVQIARELRLHVVGAEALPERLLLDRRRIGYDAIRQLGYEPTRENLDIVRREAAEVANRAQLIARTETAGAAHEAAVRAAIESPVIAGLQWFLSQRHVVVDVCDCLAQIDWYGLGAGVYDPRRTPPRPHPRCLCGLRHVLRKPSEWGEPRGDAPARVGDVDVVAEDFGLYPSQRDSLAAVLDIADRPTEERRAA